MKTSYIFNFLDKQKVSDTLPVLFDIYYENMEKITPFGKSYEDAKTEWLGQVTPAMKKDRRQIVLMYDGDALAGYAQYYTNDTILMIEEIQLKPKYQRTMLLYEFCKFMKATLPSDITYIKAYADKRNTNSQKLMVALGMKIIDETKEFYQYQEFYQKLLKYGNLGDDMELKIDNEKELKEALEYYKKTDDIIKITKEKLPLKKVSGNAYGIYVDDELVYIGERSKGSITTRLNQHFHSCSKGTSSKLEKVQAAYKDGKKVAYKTILVEPDFERYSVETYLIKNLACPWNVRDNKKTIELSAPDADMVIDD